MARTTGGDVILEMMTTVAELKDASRQQGEQLVEISTQMSVVSAQMTTMSTLTSALATRMDGNVKQYERLATLLGKFAELVEARFDEVDARLSRLEAASGK
jgi:hypothetical protein